MPKLRKFLQIHNSFYRPMKAISVLVAAAVIVGKIGGNFSNGKGRFIANSAGGSAVSAAVLAKGCAAAMIAEVVISCQFSVHS